MKHHLDVPIDYPHPTIDESREMLLAPLRGKTVEFWKPGGNWGDEMIEAGTCELLYAAGIEQKVPGDVIVLGGSGGWCRFWCSMPERLAEAEATGREVVVFPSTFDLSVKTVRRALATSSATIFAREAVSAEATGLPLAHCPSFFTDYLRWVRVGKSALYAYREDLESAGEPIPDENDDVSITSASMEDWWQKIAGARTVYTDRAHVMIAAALMGKRTRVRDCGYFKVRAMADTWLADYDVRLA